MIVELPGRTEVHYPWILALIFWGALSSIVGLAIVHETHDSGDAVWAFPIFGYGLARMRRRCVILEDGIEYRSSLGSFQKASFAEVQSVERTSLVYTGPNGRPIFRPGMSLDLPGGTPFQVPLDLPGKEGEEVFTRTVNAWNRYR